MTLEKQLTVLLRRKLRKPERYECQWITVGSQHDSETGKRKGGSPVCVKDGKITKGPKALKGRTLKRLSGGSLKTKRRQALDEAAERHGVDRRELSDGSIESALAIVES